MKFMSTWSVRSGKMAEVIAKFLSTGAPGPSGAKVIGRWQVEDADAGAVLGKLFKK